ncbi:MAG: DNA cytosine methyltransferase [Gammaproteobacteria bacterium]|nr:DNA cytosine methyltransferase [Gammaproteobacteria bacterium]
MKILIACEFSGVVRDAFIEKGHDAISCDLLSSETSGPHYQGDVYDIIREGFDLMIAHPPCTYLAVSGARWWKERKKEQEEAAIFFKKLIECEYIDKIAVENPVGIMSTLYRKPDQYIQPWQFGHGETKKTGLWLKNLPLLKPTKIVEGREQRIHKMPPSENRSKLRSITYKGIAEAMAEQWG